MSGRNTRKNSLKGKNLAQKPVGQNQDGVAVDQIEGAEGGRNDDVCQLCKQQVKENDDAVECQWCTTWEHKKCLKLHDNQYDIIGQIPANLMWFCGVCQPKVRMTLRFFNEVREK